MPFGCYKKADLVLLYCSMSIRFSFILSCMAHLKFGYILLLPELMNFILNVTNCPILNKSLCSDTAIHTWNNISWENFGCRRSPQHKGTFIPLPLDKLQLPQWVHSDPYQQYHWQVWIDPLKQIRPKNGLGYGTCWCHWSDPRPIRVQSALLHPSSCPPATLFCPFLPWSSTQTSQTTVTSLHHWHLQKS